MTELRCGDDDRRQVEQVLSIAYADGRITLAEHDERLNALWQAKTFAELRPITADLTVVEAHIREQLANSYDDGYPRAMVDLSGPDKSLERITSILSSHKRTTEPWRLRKRNRVIAVMAEVKLDLTAATWESNEVALDVLLVMSELKLRVPAGVHVQADVSTVMGEVNQTGLLPEPGGPQLIIKGKAVMSTIKVQGPVQKSWTQKLFRR